SGIFAGDARQLSVRACFPKIWQMEADHGGLIRAAVATRRRRAARTPVGSPAGRLTSLAGGPRALIDGRTRALGDRVRLVSPVLGLGYGQSTARYPAYTMLTCSDSIEAGAVVLPGPASDAGALVRPLDPALAARLEAGATAPLAVVCLGFDRSA